MTETAKMAHVVLPAASFVEKEGTYTNLERRVQRLNPLRPPVHESKSDFDIFSRAPAYARMPCCRLETPEAVFKEISTSEPQLSGHSVWGTVAQRIPLPLFEWISERKGKVDPCGGSKVISGAKETQKPIRSFWFRSPLSFNPAF